MTKDEINSYLSVGSTKRGCIDIELLADYGNIVRTIEILEGDVVEISFDTWGYDEGGVYFIGVYQSF